MSHQTDDSAQLLLAERRLLRALERFHRREPLVPDIRTDALIAMLREAPARPRSHRGATPLALDDNELRGVLDDLVARGEVQRAGHRVWLVGHVAQLDGGARGAADALLAELGAAGASPPRVEPIARRLGVSEWTIDALRQSGELVTLASGVEYPRDVLARLLEGLRGREWTVAQLRDELATSRRYAAALHQALHRAR